MASRDREENILATERFLTDLLQKPEYADGIMELQAHAQIMIHLFFTASTVRDYLQIIYGRGTVVKENGILKLEVKNIEVDKVES